MTIAVISGLVLLMFIVCAASEELDRKFEKSTDYPFRTRFLRELKRTGPLGALCAATLSSITYVREGAGEALFLLAVIFVSFFLTVLLDATRRHRKADRQDLRPLE